MKRNELIQLKELVTKEVERRKRIEKLLESDLVQEYIELTNAKVNKLDSNNIREILKQILFSHSITKTNEIYVCTSAYYMDYEIIYQDTIDYTKNVEINSHRATHKIYTDIESGEKISATNKLDNNGQGQLISTFEQNHIVLNPYNTHQNWNGYYDVKLDFFETAIKDGQAKAKKLVLTKYPRI